MRPKLLNLLALAGIAPGHDDWTRVLLVDGGGVAEPARVDTEWSVQSVGFHLIMLSADGTPTFFCKCRPCPPDSVRPIESVALEFFSAHSKARHFVAETRTARADHMELQASRYVVGRRFDSCLLTYSSRERYRAMGTILDAAACLSNAALEPPGIGRCRNEVVSIGDESAASVSMLHLMGISAVDVATIAAALGDAGTVHAVPQHRDLWPANVMIGADGSVRIIDFDEFGDVVVPLHDVSHFVRTTDDVARGVNGLWLDRLSRPDADGESMRSILNAEAQRWNLTGIQTAGCLLFYLVDIAVGIFGRKVPEAFWGRLRDELPLAATRLREAGSLERFGLQVLSPDAARKAMVSGQLHAVSTA